MTEKTNNIPEVTPEMDRQKKTLDEINSKIKSLQEELNNLWEWQNQQRQEEIKTTIASLKEKRDGILETTKQELSSEKIDVPVTSEDKELIAWEIASSDLPLEEKERLTRELSKANSSKELTQNANFWEWIWALILRFIAFLTWYKYNRDFDDNMYYNEYTKAKLEILDWDQERFIKDAKPIALEIEKKFGIPWQVSLAQWALESWRWKSEAAIKHWVYFWVKARKWQESVNYKTKEQGENWLYETNANFVKYDWMKESFYGYAKFLALENPRYKPAFKYGYDINPRPSHYPEDYSGYNPLKFLIEIKKAWYATDNDYLKNMSWVIKSINSKLEN